MSIDQVQRYDLTHLESKLKCELRSEFREQHRALQSEIWKLSSQLEEFKFYVMLGVGTCLPFLVIFLAAGLKS